MSLVEFPMHAMVLILQVGVDPSIPFVQKDKVELVEFVLPVDQVSMLLLVDSMNA